MENEIQNEQEGKSDADLQKEQYEALILQNRLMKKLFLKILLIIGASLVALFLIVVGVNALLQQGADDADKNIFFYPPYEGNIFDNPAYLDLDRKIYYFDGMVKRSIEDDNLADFEWGVLYLCDFIDTMKYGDADAYNACFTKNPQQAEFSQQMIYDTLISYESSSGDANGDQLITYKLEYRIYRNDGSLRRDVGSDVIQPQFVVLRITAHGDISIESLSLTR